MFLMDSSVAWNPRFPKKRVGAGCCFCAARIRCAVFDLPIAEFAVVPVAAELVAVVGRPVKSAPA